MLGRLLTTLLCICSWRHFTYAVFTDEAFVTDWQIQNVGDYFCVIGDTTRDVLVVISELDGSSLLSYVNASSGDLLSRIPLDFEAQGAMIMDNMLVLRKSEVEFLFFDIDSGFQVFDTTNRFVQDVFESECRPSLQGLEIENYTIKSKGLQVDLKKDFKDISYLKSSSDDSLDILYSTHHMEYVFKRFVNGEEIVSWYRDESTRDIIDFKMVDLEDPSILELLKEVTREGSFGSTLQSYVYRLRTNLAKFNDFVKSNSYNPGKIITKLLALENDTDDTYISKQNYIFGFSKLLLVLTRSGNVIAMDMANKGSRSWNIDTELNEAISMSLTNDKKFLKVFSSTGQYVVYDISKGRDIPIHVKRDSLSYKIKSIRELDEGEDRYLVTTHDDKLKLVDFNSNSGTQDGQSSQIFIATHDSSSLVGHMLNNSTQGDLQVTWEKKMPASERIVAYAAKDTAESGGSIATILGSRDVLYKYLYPNLAAYVSVNDETKELFVSVIDTVTGDLLFIQKHSDMVDSHQPINIILSENWIVYSYFGLNQIPEQRIAVIELYESLEPNEKHTEIDTTALSGKLAKPEAFTQAYLFPETIKNMIVSKSKFGITTKAVIIELSNGQVAYISKFMLNARRKEESKLTDDDKKELVVLPYTVGIPINDYLVLTHYRNFVPGQNSKLISVPTNLESTSYVCDIGFDLFCTKVAISGQFDIMSPGFEKNQLIITVLVLVAVYMILSPMVAKRKLKGSWLVRD